MIDALVKETTINSLSSLASGFRERMTKGQSVGARNLFRTKFYVSVVEYAKEVGASTSIVQYVVA